MTGGARRWSMTSGCCRSAFRSYLDRPKHNASRGHLVSCGRTKSFAVSGLMVGGARDQSHREERTYPIFLPGNRLLRDGLRPLTRWAVAGSAFSVLWARLDRGALGYVRSNWSFTDRRLARDVGSDRAFAGGACTSVAGVSDGASAEGWPSDPFRGLFELANGIVAGLSGDALHRPAVHDGTGGRLWVSVGGISIMRAIKCLKSIRWMPWR